MPKVSVIIPVFKAEQYIEKCARSLFSQTLDDIEYIFVDDCTPDNSIEILKKIILDYPNREPQVKIHRMEKNSGQAAVRKWGINHATGDYVIHCDSDDWVDINAYHEMYTLAVRENADIVICDFIVTDNVNVRLKKGCHSIDKNTFFNNLMLNFDNGSLGNKLVRKSVCERNVIFPKGDMGEDLFLCLQYTLNSNKIRYISKGFYFYYRNLSSITKSKEEESIYHKFKQSILNAEDLIALFENRNLNKEYHYHIDRMLFAKKNLLRPLAMKKRYWHIWKNTFPQLNYVILSNPYISLKNKIKHVLVLVYGNLFFRF